MDVRVVVICSGELDSISIGGEKMEGLSAIKHKPIPDWFVPSNDRSGWEGLIEEIRKKIDDDKANLSFEFIGAKEEKQIFEKMLSKYGYSTGADGLSIEDIAKEHLEEAKKAEHRGLYDKALREYTYVAEQGKSIEAAFCVAEYYFDYEEKKLEIDKEEAISKAIDYYERAAKLGHKKAQYKLYEILSTDDYVKSDRDAALYWLEKVAESGDDKAQVELGDELYDEEYSNVCKDGIKIGGNSHKLNKRFKRALGWYLKATEKENDKAYMRVARSYKYGHGVEENQCEAFEWYEKAANAGNIRGDFQCAECYYYGRGTKKDKLKAYELYKKVAEKGEADACYKVGKCYEYGYGIEEDQEKAFEWYLKAAKYNYVRAQAEVAYRLDIGNGVEKDGLEAEKWYLRAAENGVAWSQRNLGMLYETGELGKPDYNKAFYWYSKSAENGDDGGQCNLGRCYDFGIGVKQNYAEALDWYRKSSSNDNAISNYYLGICYEEGKGVDKNLETAYQWYKKGADAPEPDMDCCFKVGEYHYAKKNPYAAAKTGALLALSVLVPVTNFVTIPAAIVGAAANASGKDIKFLKTEAGKEMMKYYRKAAALGHGEAKERVKQLETYEK